MLLNLLVYGGILFFFFLETVYGGIQLAYIKTQLGWYGDNE